MSNNSEDMVDDMLDKMCTAVHHEWTNSIMNLFIHYCKAVKKAPQGGFVPMTLEDLEMSYRDSNRNHEGYYINRDRLHEFTELITIPYTELPERELLMVKRVATKYVNVFVDNITSRMKT